MTRGWLYETRKASLDELLQWLRYCYMEFCLDPKKALIWRYLAHRGEERGGWDKAGSIIWADFWEHVDKFNDLQEDFEEADSEIETGAREAIAEDFAFVAKAYGFEADREELIATREW